jgi:hypothetical protein
MSESAASLLRTVATPAGQEYAVISIVGPPCNQKTSDTLGVVIRGIFPSIEDAKAWAESQHDGRFDIFVVRAGEWFPLPPDYEHISDVKYNDERLARLMNAHVEEQLRARNAMDVRVAEAVASSSSSSAVASSSAE